MVISLFFNLTFFVVVLFIIFLCLSFLVINKKLGFFRKSFNLNCFYTSFWLDENESDDYVSNDSSITSENVNNSSENDDDKIDPYGDEIKKWSREKLLKFCADNKLISKPLRFDVYTNDKIIYWIQRWYSGYNLELEMDLDLRNFELFQLREYCNFLSIDFNNSKNELEIACMIANINRKNTSFSFLYFLTNNELKKDL